MLNEICLVYEKGLLKVREETQKENVSDQAT